MDRGGIPRLIEAVAETLAIERERWVLWLPVAFGAGIAVYFALPAEPPLWLGAAVTLAVAACAGLGRRRAVVLVALLGIGAATAGFSVAQWRTAAVAEPMLSKRLGPTSVTGRIVAVERFPKGSRVSLERLRITRLGPQRTPATVRLRLQGHQPAIAAGDWIRARAVLSPPPPPAAPGAFDFQRQSYFRRLGAVGFAFGPVELIAKGEERGLDSLSLGLERLRRGIADSVMASLDGRAGTVAAALMTGTRKAIEPKIMTAIRDAGLAHLLAISGLHVGLVTAILFVGLRGALALAPPLALGYPIKKWAAAAAIVGAFAYALLAGATVPTQRAFLMIGLVMLAVIFDRRGLSMRLVAWAAFVILLLAPESLLGASFQLSFAAVTALIAAYEVVRDRRRYGGGGPPRWLRTALLYVAGVALTTVIAEMATAPFVVYHFNRLAVYGLAANVIAVPVTALWIMPWSVAAFALMPLGLETLALEPMGRGIEVVVSVAETVSGWPGAVTLLPAMPTWGLVLIALGGLWLCLWRRRWRLWGALGVAAGLMALGLIRPPDVLVDGRGKLLAVRTADGGLAVSSKRAAGFSRQVWHRRAGREDSPLVWPRHGLSRDGRLSCDGLGCIYRARGLTVALVGHPAALADDCRVADVVVSTVPVRRPCPSAKRFIDRFDLWREGGHALWLDGGRVRVESVNSERGERPWVVRPEGAGKGRGR